MKRCFRKSSRRIMYEVKEVIYFNNYKKHIVRLVAFGTIFFFVALLSFSPHLWHKSQHTLMPQYVKFPTDLKYILFWKAKSRTSKLRENEFDFSKKKKDEFHEGQSLFIEQKCPMYNCYITYNPDLLPHEWYFDAIVFDVHEIRHKRILEFNFTRAAHQRYIFRSMESSENHYMCSKHFDDFFNLTWTYKLDSDIPHPFFNIYNTTNDIIGPSKNINWIVKMKRNDKFLKKIKYKTKAVAWLINHCSVKDQYSEFFSSLQRELAGYNLTIDTFGACGDISCEEGLFKCYKRIERGYFFQLVTDEASDTDFVTEHVARVMQQVTIPIVVGDADYRNFLPPGSYINAKAFDLKKVGAIIDYLIKNRNTFYNYFFDWKNHYLYNTRPKNYVCDLCAKLNEQSNHSVYYGQFRKWWNPEYEDVCLTNRLFYKFSKYAARNDSL